MLFSFHGVKFTIKGYRLQDDNPFVYFLYCIFINIDGGVTDVTTKRLTALCGGVGHTFYANIFSYIAYTYT